MTHGWSQTFDVLTEGQAMELQNGPVARDQENENDSS